MLLMYAITQRVYMIFKRVLDTEDHDFQTFSQIPIFKLQYLKKILGVPWWSSG